MMLSIDAIATPANVRRVAASADADAALAASMRAIGMIQPVLVLRAAGGSDQYALVAGHRRLAAARALGWSDIPAVEVPAATADNVTALGAAENMVRAAMHPVDQWRAICTMIDAGMTRQDAADALGLAPGFARRLEHLGRMAPEVVDAIAAAPGLPDTATLRAIALAPHDAQRKALLGATGRKGEVNWWRMGEGCKVTRIPAARALFDTAGGAVTFDEDLFAEPGSDEQFTTTDVKGFIAAQSATLAERAAASKGHIEVLPYDPLARIAARLPRGWQASFDPLPKRWKKTDPRRAFICVIERGWEIGDVETCVAHPVAQRVAGKADAREDRPETEAAPRGISKVVQDELALLKDKVVREQLAAVVKDGVRPTAMLRALLVMLAADNVSLPGRYGAGPYRDIARKLVDDAGQPKPVADDEINAIAADAIGRIVRFPGANAWNASGRAAEWLATMIGADMPRCDTAEILRGVPGPMLVDLAKAAGINAAGKVSDLRKRLEGNLPDWRPVTFGHPGPLAVDDLRDDTEDDEAADDADETDQREAAE